jgi:hypothetical protein
VTELVELVAKLGAVIGPVGVFALLAFALYLQGTRTKRYHTENIGTLAEIQKSAHDADEASVETLQIVRAMNGRLIALEVWKQLHTQRFEKVEEALERAIGRRP